MNPFDGLNPFEHTVLAYMVVIGLLWGYAMKLWWASRRRRPYGRKPLPGAERDHT